VGGIAVGGTAVAGAEVGDSGVGVVAGPQAETRSANKVIIDKTSKVMRLGFIFSSPIEG
jgi:hypothetical protein